LAGFSAIVVDQVGGALRVSNLPLRTGGAHRMIQGAQRNSYPCTKKCAPRNRGRSTARRRIRSGRSLKLGATSPPSALPCRYALRITLSQNKVPRRCDGPCSTRPPGGRSRHRRLSLLDP
jgi:hypothetical protein